MTPPPLARDSSLTLLTPCMTPVCCSPETSITSSVRSSQGIWGKLMFRCISIFSPAEQSSQLGCSCPSFHYNLTSPFINNQLGMNHHPSVVPPFPQRQVQDDKQRSYRDNSSRGCSYSRLIDSLGKSIQPCKSRFRRHYCRSVSSYPEV